MSQSKTVQIKGVELSAFFSSVLRNSALACILILDRNGVIVEISKGVQQTFGYTEDDLIGRNFEILFIEEDRAQKLPAKELEAAMMKGSAVDNNYLLHKQGQRIWCQGESIVIRDVNGEDFFVKFVYNINDQKLLEKSLEASKKFSEGIIETIKEALLVLDEDFRIVSSNAAFMKTFNIEKGISGKLFFDICNQAWNLPKLRNLLEKVLPESSSVKDFKVELDYPDGKRTYCLNGRQLLIEGEKQRKIVIVFEDITNQENTRARLDAQNLQLNEVNKDLDVFVYTASHDLKEPINNIEALVTLISEDKECGNKLKSIVNMLQESVLKFKTTLTDLSATAKTQTLTEGVENIEFKETLENVKFDLSKQIRENSAFIIDDFSNAPAIRFSKKNLRSIFYNLLSNAIKYRYPGRIPEVSLTTEKRDGHILLKVADNGLGFKPEHLDKIGNQYQRFQPQLEGTGIGLSIVKRIVENNGGKMEVASKEGKGTTFNIYFKQ